MGTIKIQINSAEALERFIGNNPEIEIEIQKQVAFTIINKHLNHKINNIGDELIERVLCDFDGTGWNKKLRLKPAILESATNQIKSKIEVLLSEIALQVCDVNEIKGKSLELLEKQATWIEKELSKEVLSGRIEKMVDDKIKIRMGIK